MKNIIVEIKISVNELKDGSKLLFQNVVPRDKLIGMM